MRSDEETAPKDNVLPFRSRKSTYEDLYTERKDKFRTSVLDLVDETIRHGGLHPADFADALFGSANYAFIVTLGLSQRSEFVEFDMRARAIVVNAHAEIGRLLAEANAVRPEPTPSD